MSCFTLLHTLLNALIGCCGASRSTFDTVPQDAAASVLTFLLIFVKWACGSQCPLYQNVWVCVYAGIVATHRCLLAYLLVEVGSSNHLFVLPSISRGQTKWHWSCLACVHTFWSMKRWNGTGCKHNSLSSFCSCPLKGDAALHITFHQGILIPSLQMPVTLSDLSCEPHTL